MSYKKEYLQLKRDLADQVNLMGSFNSMNSKLTNELSNLSFVLNDKILGKDSVAIIYSLINEFNKIAHLDLHHNLELSQYYDVKLSKCDNCEIVLCYINSSVCLSNKKVNNGNIDCTIGKGTVKFYVKQKIGDMYRYTKINVVKVQPYIEPSTDMLYHNDDDLAHLTAANGVALSQMNPYAILSAADRGHLAGQSPSDVKKSLDMVDSILNKTSAASMESQLSKLGVQRAGAVSDMPSKSSIEAANVVANHVNGTTVLVPGNNSIALGSDVSVNPVYGLIGKSGVKVHSTNSLNTFNVATKNRAGILVDANVAMVPRTTTVPNTIPLTKNLYMLGGKQLSEADRDALVPINMQSRLSAITQNGNAVTQLYQFGFDMENLPLDELIRKYGEDTPDERVLNQSIVNNLNSLNRTSSTKI